METSPFSPTQSSPEPHLLEILTSLNQIGAAINRIGPGEEVDSRSTLSLIVESAIKVIPGASAVLYTFDAATNTFDPSSRVSAGERGLDPQGIESPSILDVPRPDGIGQRAIQQRRRVLSYEERDLKIHPAISAVGARAVACFPLIVAEQPVGALYVYLHEERAFSQLEQLMIDNLVNQAAMALNQIYRMNNIRRDLARKDEELKHQRRAALLISSRLQLRETLETILQMALEVTHARYGIFRLLDPDGLHLSTRAIAGEELERPLIEALPVQSTSVMGWVALHRQPLCIQDLHASPWRQIYYPLDAHLLMRSELAVPLISASGRLEGVLNLESPVVGAFSEEDSRLLQSFATQAVIAIQEVRLLDALQEVAQLLLSKTCPQVLSRLAELAGELLNTSAAHIWQLHGNELHLQAACGCLTPESPLPLNGSLEGQAVLTRRIVVFNQQSAGAVAEPLNALWNHAIVVPLLASGDQEALGAFSIYFQLSEPGHFSESDWDQKVLSSLAYYAALAIQNASHQEALRTAQEQRAVAETFAAVGDIAANLLHHLNNKVGTIPVRIQGIQDKCEATLATDRYLSTNLEEIERSANEAMQAMRENLSHLRPIHISEVQVANCVAEAVEEANLPESIQVHLEGLDTLPPVMAGQRSLSLVFTNLLENAADAMRGSGMIFIRGTRQTGWAEVSVSDSGPGIAPELHERIFEFNFSGRKLQRPSKLGFGLWWVKTLMVRLNGSVWVESDGRRGTTFHLRLPVAEEK